MTERQKERRLEYKNVSKIVKSVVSRAKLNKYDELYEHLGTQG